MSQRGSQVPLVSSNEKLYKLEGDLLALEYVRKISYETFDRKTAEEPGYIHFMDSEYRRLILFEDTIQVSRDLRIPTNGVIKTSLPGNRLLVKIENYDKEEDFTRYEVYQLVRE